MTMPKKLTKSQINRLAWHMALGSLKPGKGRSRRCAELWPVFIETVTGLSEKGIVDQENFEATLGSYP